MRTRYKKLSQLELVNEVALELSKGKLLVGCKDEWNLDQGHLAQEA